MRTCEWNSLLMTCGSLIFLGKTCHAVEGPLTSGSWTHFTRLPLHSPTLNGKGGGSLGWESRVENPSKKPAVGRFRPPSDQLISWDPVTMTTDHFHQAGHMSRLVQESDPRFSYARRERNAICHYLIRIPSLPGSNLSTSSPPVLIKPENGIQLSMHGRYL